MKFRTEIKIEPLEPKIDYSDSLLLLGSCFADEMLQRLRQLKFRAAGNFSGPLFNPSSIAATLRRTQDSSPALFTELHRSAEGEWFHFMANTLISDADPEKVLARYNAAIDNTRRQLRDARHLIVTFGTAWVYRLRSTGEVVTNCHRQPQSIFLRERLSVEEIVEEWSSLIENQLRDKNIILTVSPIRHLSDGLGGNALSKATLRVAAAELEQRFENVRYFPSFEIMTDDLRDYRFYKEDMVHPTAQAVDYIWEQFSAAAFTPHTLQLIAEVGKVIATLSHRPLHPDSEACKRLCATTAKKAEELSQRSGIDFSEEIERLNRASYH